MSMLDGLISKLNFSFNLLIKIQTLDDMSPVS